MAFGRLALLAKTHSNLLDLPLNVLINVTIELHKRMHVNIDNSIAR